MLCNLVPQSAVLSDETWMCRRLLTFITGVGVLSHAGGSAVTPPAGGGPALLPTEFTPCRVTTGTAAAAAGCGLLRDLCHALCARDAFLGERRRKEEMGRWARVRAAESESERGEQLGLGFRV